MEQRYEATFANTERLHAMGYEVIELWECDLVKELTENEIGMYTETHPGTTLSPLNPGDSLYGGRIGNCVKDYKV